MKNRFALIRILGNDLPPRHAPNQTEKNLEYILDYEFDYPDVWKAFYLNRIVDSSKAALYKSMIESRGYAWQECSFDPAAFRKISTSFARVGYLTNVNAARNAALRWGLENAGISLPMDGGCCFRDDGWDAFERTASACPNEGYYLLGQWRVPTYQSMKASDPCSLTEEYHFSNGTSVTSAREYAVAFTELHDVVYNENLLYANVDKVELLWRLGVSGVWDKWSPDIRMVAKKHMSKWAGQCKQAGWIARLPSGNPEGDANNILRGQQRLEGLTLLCEQAMKS